MSFKIAFLVISALVKAIFSIELTQLEILGIEPNAGPEYGETRVTVRLNNFDKNLIDDYDRPKVREKK